MRQPRVRERPAHHAERCGEHREKDLAAVPAHTVEAQDESDQVERQRHDPEQRNSRDILRNVAGDRQQQRRTGRRQRAPQQLARDRRTLAVVLGTVHIAWQRRGPGGAHAATVSREHAQPDEDGIAGGPAPGLRPRGDPGLEQERVAEQRQHRREVGQREQPIRAAAGVATREPCLDERTGRGKHEIRKSYRRREKPQDQPDRAFLSGRFPERARDDRQHGEARHQQHDVQQCLRPWRQPAHRKVGVAVAQQQRGLEKDEARRPHRRGSAEPRQDLLGDDRLEQEEQERAREDRQGVEHRRTRSWGRRTTAHCTCMRCAREPGFPYNWRSVRTRAPTRSGIGRMP